MDLASLDSVSAILGALAASGGAGAIEGVRALTKDTVHTGPRKLVALLRDRFRKRQDAVGDAKLTVYEAEPTPTNAEALRGHLIAAGIERDDQIVTLAREILQVVGPAAIGPGSVAASVLTQINKDGGSGFVGGQHVHHHGSSSTSSAVRWDLLPLSGEGFELRNAGTATAYQLQVTANVSLIWPDAPPTTLAPGAGAQFICAPSLADPLPLVEVLWTTNSSGGETRRWQRPLPR